MDNKNSEKEHLIGYDKYDQSGKGLIKKRRLKQNLGMVALILLVIVVIAVCICFFIFTRKKQEVQNEQFGMNFGGKNNFSSITNNLVTASGTTSVGMNIVTNDIDYLKETTLCIEEVYLSSNDEVTTGTKILKLTDDSVAAAKKELKETYEEAELSYRSGVISTEQSKISAKYDYEQVMLEANQAKQVYEDKLASLEADYSNTLEKYNDAKESYDELYELVANNGFEEYYDIPNLYKQYLEIKELYEYCYDKWEITESDLSNTVSKQQLAFSRSEKTYYVKAIQELQTLMDDAKSKYDAAQDKYNDALVNSDLNLRVKKNELDSAKLSLDAAAISLEKNKLSAKTIYETALAKATTAKNDYDTNVASLEESLDKLYDAMDDAKDHMEHFENTAGDGYLYTKEDGTVMMVAVKDDDSLSGSTMIMAYSVPSEITVSVSVSQEYIAQIEVGEAATVSFSDNQTFNGIVTSINPISSSSSRTSVTYSVIVELEGDVSGLSSNLTATVIFGNADTQSFERPSRDNQNGEKPSMNPGDTSESSSGEMSIPNFDGSQMPNFEGGTNQMPSGAGGEQRRTKGGSSNE